MAQTIQLKRGGVGALSTTVTANIGEVLIVTGSANNLEGPFLVVGIGDTSASLVNPVQLGTTVPTLDANNKQLNGTLFYDTDDNKLYRLDSGGNTEITLGALQNEARFALTGSTNFFKDSQIITGSTLLASPDTAPTETRAASSTNNNYALVVSQSAYFSNHNVGHPNSLAWQSNLAGSIFNNYDANTDVAEILRTFAGLISASNSTLVASPTPLATKYSGYNAEAEQLPSDSSDFDNVFLPVGFTEENAVYLNHKGFNNGAGSAMFSQVAASNRRTGNTNGNYGVRIDLLGGGSADAEFDAGSNSNNFTVFAKVTQSFGDAQSFASNLDADNNTFNTQSNYTFTLTPGAAGVVVQGGPSNTIDLETIATGNPTVIPPQFKKANGADIPLQTSLKNGDGVDAIAFTDISSSGYYKYHGILAGVATGSTQTEAEVIFGSLQNPDSETNVNTIIFRSPLQLSDISDTAATITTIITSASFTSRSLSGAPYLNGASYSTEATASNLFKPLYRSNATLLDGSITNSNLTFAGDTTQTVTIQSDGDVAQANRVYNGDVARSINDNPGIDDTCRIAETYSFGAGDANESNIIEGGIGSDTSFDYTVTSRNFKNATTEDDTTIPYHTAGTFGQPVASGALAYFISDDGDDSGTTSQENFKGETYRRTISDSTTLTTAWDSGSRLTLGDGGDLQVKPGFLVNPEHNNTVSGAGKGYWYPYDNFSATAYKWYLREFTISGATSQLTLTLMSSYQNDLVTWDTTTNNKFSIGLIFETQVGNVPGTDARVKVYDVEKGTGTHALDNQSSGNNNPFSDAIDIKGNFDSVTYNSSNIVLNLKSAAGQQVAAGDKVWVLVRYKGAPATTITNIGLS